MFLVRKTTGADKDRMYAMKMLKKISMDTEKKIENMNCERLVRLHWDTNPLISRIKSDNPQVLEAIRDCPFLATLRYAFQTPAKLYLVLDYVCGGELTTHLCANNGTFPVDRVRHYVAEIVLALDQLHRRNIVYRDLTLENLLLDADGHIVLTDFGLCKRLGSERGTDRTYSYCGPIEYMAPEMLATTAAHDIACDWWSLGVLTFELLVGTSPFTSGRCTIKMIEERIQSKTPVIPRRVTGDVRNFIRALLVRDPRKRLNGNRRDAGEIMAHPFFACVDWTALAEKRVPAPFQPIVAHPMDTSNFHTEFTRMDATDFPTAVPTDQEGCYRGYSFVAEVEEEVAEEVEEVVVVEWEATRGEGEDGENDGDDGDEDDGNGGQESVPRLQSKPTDVQQLMEHIPKVSVKLRQ